MSDFLTILAESTLTMGAAIVLLLVLGPLLARRYATRWRYWVWLLVALRLLLPFSLSLPQAPVRLETPPDRVLYTAPPAEHEPLTSTDPAPDSGSTLTPAVPSAAPVQDQEAAAVSPASPALLPRIVTLEQVLFWVWAAGALLFLAWYLAGGLRFARWLRRWGEPVRDAPLTELWEGLCGDMNLSRPPRLLLCPGLEGPMLAGLFRPAVLLPLSAREESPGALRLALRHELTHWRRRDIWYKTLLLLANAVHWFNPLVWIMRRAADRDMELCCDAGVVRVLSGEERAAYGDVIVAALRGGRRERSPLP